MSGKGKGEDDDDENGSGRFADKRISYILRDIKQGQDALTDRLDEIQEGLEAQKEEAEETPVTKPRFRSVGERAAFETATKTAATMHVTAVRATRTGASQQEETLAILEHQQTVGDMADEAVLEFASLISEHELLKRLRTKKPLSALVMRALVYVLIGIGAIVVLVGIFYPQNFALIVQGLQDIRVLLILIVAVAVVLAFTLYYWFRGRGKPAGG